MGRLSRSLRRVATTAVVATVVAAGLTGQVPASAAPGDFIFSWSNVQEKLPISIAAGPTVDISCSDGVSFARTGSLTSANNGFIACPSGNYGPAVTVTLSNFSAGDVTWLGFPGTTSAGSAALTAIQQWGNFQVTGPPTSTYGLFHGFGNLASLPATGAPDIATTDFSRMFSGTKLVSPDLSAWSTSSVTTFESMFSNISTLTSPNLANLVDSSATNLKSMFNGSPLVNADLSTWNVSNVTNMEETFRAAAAFNSDISGWNVANVTNMKNMFLGASTFNQNIGGWNVGNVTDMQYMFFLATSFNAAIGSWDVTKVSNFTSMFDSASAFNQDLGGWAANGVISSNASAFFAGFLDDSGMSIDTLSDTLTAWGTQTWAAGDAGSLTCGNNYCNAFTAMGQPNNALGASGLYYIPSSITNLTSGSNRFTTTALPAPEVVYDANGATSGTVPSSEYVRPGAYQASPNTGNLEKSGGFYFYGWCDNAVEVAATKCWPATSPTLTHNISATTTLYAIFRSAWPAVFNGAGNTGGSPPATMYGMPNGTVTLPTAGTLVKSGFTFSGWSNGTPGTLQPGDPGPLFWSSGTTYSAVWTANGGGGGGGDSGGGGGDSGGSTPASTPTPTPAPSASPSAEPTSTPPTAPTSPLIPTGEPTTPPVIPPITWPGASGGEPIFDPGVAECLCVGDPDPVAVDDEDGDVQVSANGTTTTLEPKTSSGAPASGTGGSGAVVVPGGTTTVGGSGYQPGSTVTVYAQPGSIPLGTLTVGPNGAVTGSVFIPPTLPKTGVTLQIDGVPFGGGPSSGPISVAVGVATGTPASGTSGSAGSTGKGAAGVPATPNLGASGKPPVVKPGAGKVTPASGGKKPKVDPNGVSVELPDGGSLQATPAGPTGIKNAKPGSGSSGGKKNAPKVQPGGFVEVKGKGLEPGTSANVWFDPAGSKPPVYGGSTQASSNGEVKGWVNIPNGLPKGNATMQIDVVTKGKAGKPGKGVTISAGVEVGGPPPVVGGKPAAPITPKSSTWPGGGSSGPSLPAGSSSAVCSGCAANPPVTGSSAGAPKSKTLEVGGTTIGLGSTGAGGASNPQSGESPLVVTPGGFTTVSGSGFRPGTTVSVYANPGKVLLGTVTVGPGGTITGSLPVPTTVPTNATVQLDGVTTGGAGQSVATGTTTTPPVTPAGPLAGLGEGPGSQPPAPIAGSNGAAPEVKPGKTAMLPAVPAVASPTVSNGTISTGLPTGGTLSVTPVNDKGNSVGGSSAAAVKPVSGGLVGVKGSGFAPGTTVQVWFLPGPIFGGSVSVGPDGTVDGWATVPQGTKPGGYTMQVSGTGQTSTGTKAPVAWSQGVTVQPSKGSGAGAGSGAGPGKSGSTTNGGAVLPPVAQPVGLPGGGLPEQAPGTTSAVAGAPIPGGATGGGVGGPTSTSAATSGEGNTPVTTTTTTSGGGTTVTVTATGSGSGGSPEVSSTVEVTGQNSGGATQPVSSGSVSAPQGGFVGAGAGGLAPGTTATVFLLPSLTPVGTGTVGSNGTVTVVSPVPTSTPPGNKTLQIAGTTPSGVPLAVNVGVTITSAPTSGPGATSPVTATSPLAVTPRIFTNPKGSPFTKAPGQSAVLVNGAAAEHTVSKSKESLTVTTPQSTVVVRAPIDEAGALTLTAGTSVAVQGTGALPGSVVDVWSTDGVRLLGRIMVAADGTYSGSILIPTTLPVGAVSLQINSTLGNGAQQTAVLGARFVNATAAGGAEITQNRVVTAFTKSSSKLTKQTKAALREFAALFPTNAFSVTTVTGAFRTEGARLGEQQLALKRAATVKRFLEQQGVQGIVNVDATTNRAADTRPRRVVSIIGG